MPEELAIIFSLDANLTDTSHEMLTKACADAVTRKTKASTWYLW